MLKIALENVTGGAVTLSMLRGRAQLLWVQSLLSGTSVTLHTVLVVKTCFP